MRGDWQGRRKAMALFCLSLSAALGKCPALRSENQNTYVSIQDDTYLVGNIKVIVDNWDGLTSALAAGGHEVNHSKSECWVPCLDSISTASLPGWLAAHLDKVTRAVGGVKALGTVAQGSYECYLGPWQRRLEPAIARVENVRKGVERLLE